MAIKKPGLSPAGGKVILLNWPVRPTRSPPTSRRWDACYDPVTAFQALIRAVTRSKSKEDKRSYAFFRRERFFLKLIAFLVEGTRTLTVDERI
jgi:hypothetical protein